MVIANTELAFSWCPRHINTSMVRQCQNPCSRLSDKGKVASLNW